MLSKLILAGLLAAAMASAQRGGGGGGGGGEGGMGSDPSRSDAFQMSRVSKFDQISDALKLNKDQKKTLKTTMDEGQKEATPLREQMARSRRAIAEAIAAGGGAEDVKKAIASYAELEAQMTQIELQAFAKIYQSLEKEQQGKAAPVYMMMAGIFKTKNWNE